MCPTRCTWVTTAASSGQRRTARRERSCPRRTSPGRSSTGWTSARRTRRTSPAACRTTGRSAAGTATATPAPNGWNSMYGGDGQQNLIDPANNKIVYSCLQYGNCQVSTDGGNTGTEFDNGPTSLNPDPTGTVSARNAYFTPMAFDPTAPDTVYWSGDIVNVSNDDGATWRAIS